MNPTCPRREKAMQISRIVTNGYARDEALKRRNSSMGEALGKRPAPSRKENKPDEPKADEKPSE
jgi:hypothetical protein